MSKTSKLFEELSILESELGKIPGYSGASFSASGGTEYFHNLTADSERRISDVLSERYGKNVTITSSNRATNICKLCFETQ